MNGFWRSLHGLMLPVRVAGTRHDWVAALLDYLPQRLVWDAGLVLLFAVSAAQAVLDGEPITMLSGAALVGLAMMARSIHQPEDAIDEGLLWLIFWAEVVVWGTIADTLLRAVAPTAETNLPLNVLFVVEWLLYCYLIVDLVGPPRERKRVRLPRFSLLPRTVPSPA